MRRAAWVLTAVTALLAGCSRPTPPGEAAGFHSIPASGWAYGDTLEFEPTPEQAAAAGTGRIAIAVRHTNGYLYSNLWLELATPVPGTDSMRLDTVNIPLADVYGKWYGRGVGVSYVAVDTLAGTYGYDSARPARLRHIMRVDTLPDVEQIGLILFPDNVIPDSIQ